MGRRERSSQTAPIVSAANPKHLRDKTQIPARCGKTRRRGRRSTRHGLTAQNLRIGTLYAARNYCVPTLDFCGWLQAQSCSSAVCKFLDESYGFFCPKAVPLKRQSAKIEWMHPTVCHWVKDWMISIFIACLVFCNFARCPLTARVCVRVR